MATNPFAQFVQPAANPFAQFLEQQPTTLAGQIPGAAPGVVAPPPAPEAIPFGRRAIQFVRPTVEALGAAGGATLGTSVGPLGTVGGAGLGYGLAKGGLDVLEQTMGYQQPPSTASEALIRGAKDVTMGAAFEAGGRAIAPAVGAVVGKIADLRQIPQQKAADIAKQSLGRDLDSVITTLRNAPPNASVAEITAGIENPTWQALVSRSLERDPQFVRKLNLLGERESRNALAQLAGGETATEIRAGLDAAKTRLNALTGPQREAALNRANLGKSVAEYEAQAGKLSAEAAAEVQKVRDLISAGNSAEAWARLDLIKRGLPVGATKYTFFGELSDKAFNEWASQAANASLDLGQGARFAQGAADALRSVGIKPLESQPLIQSLAAVSRNPEFAGNREIQVSLKRVADDIAQWTSNGGVIDAKALDAIRKNSVNAAIRDLNPNMDATAQRNLAAGVLTRIKPVLIDAIEGAGGTGYRQYLADYAKQSQDIAARKLTGEAARLWKRGPEGKDEFVRLVQNESPETVEKFLGPGNYNLATELAESTLDVLREQARKRIMQVSVQEQVGEGQAALRELMRQNVSKLRLPSHLSAWVTNTNKSLQLLENAIGDKTMRTLTEALKTPQGAADLLSTLPGAERVRVARVLQTPLFDKVKAAVKVAPAAALGATNMLAPSEEPQNALVAP
jgi:hypothetical protein